MIVSDRNVVPTSMKIPKGLLEWIDADVEINEEYRNRSEWIIAAIRHYQDYRIKLLAERKT